MIQRVLQAQCLGFRVCGLRKFGYAKFGHLLSHVPVKGELQQNGHHMVSSAMRLCRGLAPGLGLHCQPHLTLEPEAVKVVEA